MTQRRVAAVAGAFVIQASTCSGSDQSAPSSQTTAAPQPKTAVSPVERPEGSSPGFRDALEATGVKIIDRRALAV
jgi:hypothetical protein